MLCLDELKSLKVLIVEDEKSIADLLKSAIGDYFFRFEVAYDGEDGILKCKSVRPDFIITDIMIPKMTGLEMAKEIKKFANIPIIVLSAYSYKEKLLTAIDIGVVKYFIKPFDPDELLEYICELAKKIKKERVFELKNGYVFQDKLYHNGKLLALTKKELFFMQNLIDRKGDTISHEEIKELLWGSIEVSDERVRTFIRRLRAKTSKELIKSISGQGYYVES
jgi:DNA-binding response OmpR family regulator